MCATDMSVATETCHNRCVTCLSKGMLLSVMSLVCHMSLLRQTCVSRVSLSVSQTESNRHVCHMSLVCHMSVARCSVSLSRSPSLSHSVFISLSLTHTHTHMHPVTLSLARARSLSRERARSLSLARTRVLSFSTLHDKRSQNSTCHKMYYTKRLYS